jgi:hypothetical protein
LDMRKLSSIGPQNAWTRIKNFNGTSRLNKIWNFFGWIQIISCRSWRCLKKTGYITMTRRQSNNQCSGDISFHPDPKNSKCKDPLENISPKFFEDQDGILLFDYLPKGQTMNAEYYSSLLV